jgi:uncharacterized protein with PQ loop repeat
MSLEIFGWAGSSLLLICSIPQAIQSVRQGHSRGLSPHMLWMWMTGMALMIPYLAELKATPAIITHVFNIFVAGTITWFYYFPRCSKPEEDFLGL